MSFGWSRRRYLSKFVRGCWTVPVSFGRPLVFHNEGFEIVPARKLLAQYCVVAECLDDECLCGAKRVLRCKIAFTCM